MEWNAARSRGNIRKVCLNRVYLAQVTYIHLYMYIYTYIYESNSMNGAIWVEEQIHKMAPLLSKIIRKTEKTKA